MSALKDCITLLQKPQHPHQFSSPAFVNDIEMIMATQTVDYYGDDEFKFGIYKYNISTRKSELFIPYDFGKKSIEANIQFHTMAFDKKNERIFIYSYEGDLIIIDINSKEMQHIKSKYELGFYPISIFVNGIFHIIGGFSNKKHLIWNNSLKEFDIIHEFTDINGTGLCGAGIQYIVSRNSLLLFGGYANSNKLDTIYEFNLNDKKWRKLIQKLPYEMHLFGSIVTYDEKYIIIVSDKYIKIIQLDTMKMFENYIDIEEDIKVNYALLHYYHYTLNIDLIIDGLFRQCVTNNNIYSQVPKEIHDLVIKLYSTEYLYLFERNDSMTPKWRISVDDILSSKKMI